MSPRLGLVVVGGGVLLAACSSTNPATPPDAAVHISCPSPVTAQTLNGQPIAVQYPTPAITGGSPPVNTSCTPATGSTFPLGTTTVVCTATDQRQLTDACVFNVTVTLTAHQVAFTRFMAFGDSITAGQLPNEGDSLRIRVRVIDEGRSYPVLEHAGDG
jgi:hypothetical protein